MYLPLTVFLGTPDLTMLLGCIHRTAEGSVTLDFTVIACPATVEGGIFITLAGIKSNI